MKRRLLTPACALLIAGLGLTGCAQKPPAAGFTDASFTSMTSAVTVVIDPDGLPGGAQTHVQIAADIQHAVDTDWSDHGSAAGQALVHAACPQDGHAATTPQTTVATQLLILVASKRQQDHTWSPQTGLASATAQVIACHIDDVFRVSPYFDPNDPSRIDWPAMPIAGAVNTADSSAPHLGISALVLGTVLQSIAVDQSAAELVTTAWTHALPGYLADTIATDQETMLKFYCWMVKSSPVNAVKQASDSLTFLNENTSAGLPAETSSAGKTETSKANDNAFEQIFPDFVNVLASLGYFAPDLVVKVNQTCGLSIPNPMDPVPAPGAQSAAKLNAPLTNTDGGWSFAASSPGGVQWLYDSGISGISPELGVTSIGFADTRFVVPLP